MIIFILGLIDILGGIIILLSPGIFLIEVMKYVGIILLLKGIWSVIMDLGFIVSR